jgi:ribose/xylose/arabinose/galactoside ABC-type transport system permease subunit
VLSGKIRQWFNVPTFITTLALLTALRGAANLITGGFPLATFPDWFSFFGAGSLFGIPFPVYVFAAVFVIMQFLMNFTGFGRAVYAVGGNPEAARLSGIDIYGVKTLTLAITGMLTAISGTLLASQIGSGVGTTATGMELEVIAATIIGGTSLFGGKGRVWGTLLGVIFLGCISNGMTLLNVNEYWQLVVSGAIIVGAVLLNQVLERIR